MSLRHHNDRDKPILALDARQADQFSKEIQRSVQPFVARRGESRGRRKCGQTPTALEPALSTKTPAAANSNRKEFGRCPQAAISKPPHVRGSIERLRTRCLKTS